MRMQMIVIVSFCCLSASHLLAQEAQVFKQCAPFVLNDFRGRSHSLEQTELPYKVIAFLGTECPLAKLYATRLNQLSVDFAGQIAVFGINANRQDSISEIAVFAKKHEVKFPILKDLRAVVADQLGAQRTPEVFLLDSQNRIRYRGRIDDQYGVGYARKSPTREDLRIAIQELITTDNVSVSNTEAVGCFIGRPIKQEPIGDVTYANQVSRILQRHCVECHREGQIAPFSLTDYDEVVGWAETIREVIENRRMPPWHADPDHGNFANQRLIPDDDKQLLFQWMDNGMPQGEESDLPEPATYVEGWSLPHKPDLEVAMADVPYTVPADGTVEYKYFVVDPKFAEEKWVVAAEVIPGNRSVVHHAIVFVRPPEGERQEGIGWLTAFVPGQSLLSLPTGMARRIPKGSKLVFQMHYTPIGSVANDTTKVGLIFTDADRVHTEVQTRIVIDRDFEIPPGANDFEVEMSTSHFPPDSELMAIAPHMHYRGKAFQVVAESENSKEIVLNVPNYDFNWQHAYVLSERLPLNNMRIRCTATFDNSEQNPVNPDPTAKVRWGDQTWEEMAMAYLAIAVPRSAANQQRAATENARIVSEREQQQQSIEQRETEAIKIANQFFADLDENKDGEILRGETSTAFRAFAFRFFDTNNDDKLSREEVLHQARLSLRP